jgi:hypothetical protein
MNDLPQDVICLVASNLGTGDAARLSACSTSFSECARWIPPPPDAERRVSIILDFARRANAVLPFEREDLLERMGSHSKTTGVRFGRCFGSPCLTTQNVSGFLGGRYWVVSWMDVGGRDTSIVAAFERGASATFSKVLGVDEAWGVNAWTGRSPSSTLPTDARRVFEEAMGERVAT